MRVANPADKEFFPGETGGRAGSDNQDRDFTESRRARLQNIHFPALRFLHRNDYPSRFGGKTAV